MGGHPTSYHPRLGILTGYYAHATVGTEIQANPLPARPQTIRFATTSDTVITPVYSEAVVLTV